MFFVRWGTGPPRSPLPSLLSSIFLRTILSFRPIWLKSLFSGWIWINKINFVMTKRAPFCSSYLKLSSRCRVVFFSTLCISSWVWQRGFGLNSPLLVSWLLLSKIYKCQKFKSFVVSLGNRLGNRTVESHTYIPPWTVKHWFADKEKLWFFVFSGLRGSRFFYTSEHEKGERNLARYAKSFCSLSRCKPLHIFKSRLAWASVCLGFESKELPRE